MKLFDIRVEEDDRGQWRAEARWIEWRADLAPGEPIKRDGDAWRSGVCVGPFPDVDVALLTLGRLLQDLRVKRVRR